MLSNYNLKISYENEGTLYASSNPKTGHYIIDIDETNPDKLSFKISTQVRMENIKFAVSYDYDFAEGEVAFCNGYQSWTDSKEYTKNDIIPPRNFWATNTDFVAHGMNTGDYAFTIYDKKPGFLHSWSYGYTRLGNQVKLLGSLREDTGFTVIYYDFNTNKIIIEKDLEGLTLKDNSHYDLMDIFFAEGSYDEVFDKYFSTLECTTPRVSHKTGYTTWYNYYQNINNDIVTRDLDSIAKLDNKIDIFQIDDGYETAVGDWLSVDATKFPNGMKEVCDKIHAKDMMAGLWLAPFSCSRNSKVFKEHKDWIVRDEKGYPLNCGLNWGGFYCLDFYHPEVREHLKNIFNTILNDNEWNFDMVKLDFLYTVCIKPRFNKTRGRIMCDAIDFLRECCGLKLILGCGTPLFPTFGKFDFCRVGCDVAPNWKKTSFFKNLNREGVSTQNSLTSSIFRRHLDGRAFCNDPDVFMLRDSNIALTDTQKKLIAKVNKICGSVLFVSDDVSTYTADELATYNDTVANDDIIVNSADIDKNIITLVYTEQDKQSTLKFNVATGEVIEGNL